MRNDAERGSGGYVKPANRVENRRDHRLRQNQSGKRKTVVVIRERNVLITVSVSGQESGAGFGPVSVSTLQAGAEAAAKDMLAKSVAEPHA